MPIGVKWVANTCQNLTDDESLLTALESQKLGQLIEEKPHHNLGDDQLGQNWGLDLA